MIYYFFLLLCELMQRRRLLVQPGGHFHQLPSFNVTLSLTLSAKSEPTLELVSHQQVHHMHATRSSTHTQVMRLSCDYHSGTLIEDEEVESVGEPVNILGERAVVYGGSKVVTCSNTVLKS